MAKFSVGDEVVITDGVRNCIHGVDPDMIRMIGRIVHIVYVRNDDRGRAEYEIEEDNGRFWWCDRCFEYPTQEGDDAPLVSDDEFSEIMSFLSISDK